MTIASAMLMLSQEAARALMAVNGLVVEEKPLIVTFVSSK